MSCKIRDNFVVAFVFLIIACLYLYTRTIGWQNVFVDGRFIFTSPESGEYLRKVELLMRNFPYIPSIDYYIGYPQGSPPVWPPLFAYYIAALASLLGGIKSITTACIIAQPILGCINLGIVYILVNHVFGKTVALFAAITLVIIPVDLGMSGIGNVDHHIGELTIVLLLMYLSCKIKDAGKLLIILFGLVFWASVFLWRGATLIWGIEYVSLIVYFIVSKDTKTVEKFGIANLLAAAGIAISCRTGFMGAEDFFTFNIVSWFHFVVLLVAGSFFYLLGNYKGKRAYVFFGVLLIGFVYSFTHPEYIKEFIKAINVVQGSNAWLNTIPGFSSIFKNNVTHEINYIGPFINLTLIYLMSPYAVYLIYKKCKSDGKMYEGVTLAIWCAFLFIFPMLRARYIFWTPAAISIAGGLFFASEWFKGKTFPVRISRVFLFGVCSSIPFAINMMSSFNRDSIPEKYIKRTEALEWLDKNSPKTSYYYTPWNKPEYGVLGQWDMGSHIIVVGKRPCIGTPYGWEIFGLYPSTQLLVTGDAYVFKRIMTDCNAKYVILNYHRNSDKGFHENSMVATDESKRYKVNYGQHANTFKETIYSKIMIAEKQDVGKIVPGLQLIFENKTAKDEYCKIFQLNI